MSPKEVKACVKALHAWIESQGLTPIEALGVMGCEAGFIFTQYDEGLAKSFCSMIMENEKLIRDKKND